MVGGDSDSIASICCKIKSTMHDFHSTIFWKTQSPSCYLRRRDFFFNFRFVLHDENVWTNRWNWAGGFIGWVWNCGRKEKSWPTGWRRSWRHTTEMPIFRAQNGVQKMQSHSERYGGAQAVAKVIAKSLCEWQKHFAPLPGRPEDPGLATQEHRRAHPARHLTSPALLIVAPSFILSVALEDNRLTNRTLTTKATRE